MPRNATASLTVILPLAMGLSLVLFTNLSRFLSHRSLTVQPAPRIRNAPVVNKAVVVRAVVVGMVAAYVAREIEDREGRRSKREPAGEVMRASLAYWASFWQLFIVFFD